MYDGTNPLPTALLFIFGAMMLFIGLTRVVAEGGIPAMRPPIMTSSFVISGAGASALGASGLVALGLFLRLAFRSTLLCHGVCSQRAEDG